MRRQYLFFGTLNYYILFGEEYKRENMQLCCACSNFEIHCSSSMYNTETNRAEIETWKFWFCFSFQGGFLEIFHPAPDSKATSTLIPLWSRVCSGSGPAKISGTYSSLSRQSHGSSAARLQRCVGILSPKCKALCFSVLSFMRFFQLTKLPLSGSFILQLFSLSPDLNNSIFHLSFKAFIEYFMKEGMVRGVQEIGKM